MSFLNKELKYDANIRLRPLTEEDNPAHYLYFPFAYQEGGKSYTVLAQDVEQLKRSFWSPYSFLIAPALIMAALALFIGRGNWFIIILAALIGLYLGYKLFETHRRQMVKITETLEKQPYILTKERYDMEMALQTSVFYLWMKLFFWSFLLLFMFTTLPNVVLGYLMPLIYFAGLSIGIVKISNTWRLIKLRNKATGDEVGDIASLPTENNVAA